MSTPVLNRRHLGDKEAEVGSLVLSLHIIKHFSWTRTKWIGLDVYKTPDFTVLWCGKWRIGDNGEKSWGSEGWPEWKD